jgi:RHS repeat-associated protein
MKKIFTLTLLFVFSFAIGQKLNISPIDPADPTGPTLPIDPIDIDPVGPILSSTEVGVTAGQLSVSLSGAANYSIPFAVPSGINGVEPQIGLAYSSQSGNGMAGNGWNISGLSAITRIPSTKFHDNNSDSIDFDESDRFALDGQRLILKSGTYGVVGSVYETENYSNLKISLLSSSTNYFKVEYPDGAVAYYGFYIDSNTTINYALSYWINAQGLRIIYSYTKANNNLYISSIRYGSSGKFNMINEIKFVYKNRNRIEQSYIGGLKIINDKILSQVKINGSGIGYRNYYLTHDTEVKSYERLLSITEKTGDDSKSYNPTIFNYENTTDAFSTNSRAILIGNPTCPNCITPFPLSGDFNGDGELDIIRYPKFGENLLVYGRDKTIINVGLKSSLDPNYYNMGVLKPIIGGKFINIFTMNYLKNDSNGYKLANGNGWCEMTYDALTNKTSFNVYSVLNSASNAVNLEYTKEFNFPKSCFYQEQSTVHYSSGGVPYSIVTPAAYKESTVNKQYITGDFNGDGLTDIIAVERGYSDLDVETQTCSASSANTFLQGKTYFVNLDKRLQNNYANFSGNINVAKNDYYKYKGDDNKFDESLFGADVTGDGKTDVVVIKNVYNVLTRLSTLYVYVYSLNDSNMLVNVSTTMFEDLYFTPDPHHSPRPSLGYQNTFGDFNGDGKMDFINYGNLGHNIIISTGNTFELTHDNLSLWKQVSTIDFDNDGKSDIYTNSYNGWVSGQPLASLIFYKNINGVFSEFNSNTTIIGGAIPILTTSEGIDKKNTLSILSNNNSISKIDFSKDYNKEKLLRSITLGNGLTENIIYSPLIKDNGTYSTVSAVENYPNIDIGSTSGFKVVSRIAKFSGGVYKNQFYKYHGGVSNIEGLGFLGFRSVLKTNWFDDASKTISTVSKFDISKRGAPIESFSVLGLVLPSLNISATDSYISRSLSVFNNENTAYENPLLPNKVFKLKNTLTKTFNNLEGTSSEVVTQYNSLNSVIQKTTSIKNGQTVEQTSVENINYDTSTSSPYIVDRPNGKTNTVTIFPSGDSTNSEELYIYNVNLLKQVKKRGLNTVYITEDNDYDAYGNIIKKTLTAPGATPRIVSFEYDSSNRFQTKKIDLEGLETLYTYDANGLLLTETLPSNSGFPLITSYAYDKWGKITKSTNYLGKYIDYAYYNLQNENGIFKTTFGMDGSEESTKMDGLGRVTQQGVKNIDGKWSYVDFQYDINDKVLLKSQPYAIVSEVTNETQYDVYGRLTQATTLKSGSSPGKVINYSYSGLTTTENDGIKSKITVKNALGNAIYLTETPGGTINYEYYANGNLKSTNYNGSATTIIQDGWGRKKELNDPSAGNRKYDYNHFGELIREEVVGQGETIYDLNDLGKINFRTIKDIGGNIKSKNTYTYNEATKILTKVRLDDYANNFVSINDYVFDDYKRLINSIEASDQRASFEKIISYDDFGRPKQESYKAINTSDGKQSTKSITNTYKNGYKWQILDNPTNVVLWQTDIVNAQGQVLTAKMGNGVTIANTYDVFGFPTRIKHNKRMANIVTLDNVFEPIYSNLTSRTNDLFGSWTETLTYDQSDRLTSYNDASGVQTQSYNENGTILNNNIGSYAYATASGKPFQVSTVTPANPSSALAYYTNRAQNIAYNMFKSPVSITEENKENIDFEYNANNARLAMYYGGLQTLKNERPYFKFYSADGTMEIKRKNTAPYSVEFITYIGGDGYTAPIILKSDGVTQNYFYLHRDYQGSIMAITNSIGVVVEKRLFDVWGALIKYSNNLGITVVPTNTSELFLDRGYTGHEHLLGVGLINMNGRIYDPKLHRFLQPDNNLQDPFNTQNYNRYAYGMNNPTKYSDPSGEFWDLVLGFLFSAYVHGAQASGDPNPLNWSPTTIANAFAGPIFIFGSAAITASTNQYLTDYGKNPVLPAIVNPEVTKTITVIDISDFFSQINDNFHQGMNDRVIDIYNFVSKEVNSSLYWANTLNEFGTDIQNGRSLFINASHEYKEELFNNVIGMSVNEWAYTAGYSAPDIAIASVTPYAIEGAISRIGSLEVSVFRVYGGNSSMFGKSYSLINPEYIPYYRNFAGLPEGNTAEFLLKGTVPLRDVNIGRWFAAPLDGNSGGLPFELYQNYNQLNNPFTKPRK